MKHKIIILAMLFVKLIRFYGLEVEASSVWNEMQKELNNSPVDYWPVE